MSVRNVDVCLKSRSLKLINLHFTKPVDLYFLNVPIAGIDATNIIIKKEVIVMKRLLNLLGGGTEIILRAGDNYGEYDIRCVRFIDDNDKVCTEIRLNLDVLSRELHNEDTLWRLVCDELRFRINFAEREYYERLLKEEEEQENEDS